MAKEQENDLDIGLDAALSDYYNPEDWKRRIYAERATLEYRIQRLMAFMESPRYDKLTEVDRRLLVEQHRYMYEYYEVLGKRIIRFQVEE